MLNQVTMMGRLTSDPELKKTKSDVSVCTVRIAVDRDFIDKATGNRKCDFFDVTTWRGTADFLSKFFQKGRMIVVSGRLATQKYQDKNGNDRVSTYIEAENIYFADSKRDSGNTQVSAAPATAPMDYPELPDSEGDLPF